MRATGRARCVWVERVGTSPAVQSRNGGRRDDGGAIRCSQKSFQPASLARQSSQAPGIHPPLGLCADRAIESRQDTFAARSAGVCRKRSAAPGAGSGRPGSGRVGAFALLGRTSSHAAMSVQRVRTLRPDFPHPEPIRETFFPGDRHVPEIEPRVPCACHLDRRSDPARFDVPGWRQRQRGRRTRLSRRPPSSTSVSAPCSPVHPGCFSCTAPGCQTQPSSRSSSLA